MKIWYSSLRGGVGNMNPITIGICDDERKMREKIHQLCDVVMFRKNVEYKCIDFCDGREVLQYKHSIDLLILDIKMPRMSGIAVKRKLQERKEDTIIIYVTDYEDAIIDAFGIHVYGFVLKDRIDEKLQPMLESAINEISETSVVVDGKVDSNTILFVKSESPYCRLYIRDGKEELIRKSMRELTKMLQETNFIRVHRSYLVNFQYVEGVPDKKINIEKYKLPISRELRQEVKKAYIQYAEKRAR